ncbi:MAG TPA: SLBB domain-containing protein [Candidatus Methanoperedens sp.]|nr:SLBB domain-containing protein [Candidatus Methanoperedens sp.]
MSRRIGSRRTERTVTRTAALLLALLAGCSYAQSQRPVAAGELQVQAASVPAEAPEAGTRPIVVAAPSYTDDRSRIAIVQSLKDIEKRNQDYLVGPEDLLEISIFEWELREETKTSLFRVSETGYISIPVVGLVNVGDQSIANVRKKIEDTFRSGGFIKDPRVSVDIKEFRSKKVAVVGAVKSPGTYTLRQNVTTVLDILSLAGGLSDKAGYLALVIKQASGDKEPLQRKDTIPIDLHELIVKGDPTVNMVLGNGDVVNVPDAETYSVTGFVQKPGNYPLKRPTSALEGVAEAGGLVNKEALPTKAILRRKSATGETVIPLDLAAITKGEAQNFYLQSGDLIEVPEDKNRRFLNRLVDSISNILGLTYTLN